MQQLKYEFNHFRRLLDSLWTEPYQSLKIPRAYVWRMLNEKRAHWSRVDIVIIVHRDDRPRAMVTINSNQ